MTSLHLPYINEFRDRHGRLRRYFRRPGRKAIALPGIPGSAEFNQAYQAALEGLRPPPVGAERTVPGTLSAAIASYYADLSFRSLAPATRQMRRAILERLRAAHGEKRLATLRRPHLSAILGVMKPFAARNWLKTLRGLMGFAVDRGLRIDDPTSGVRLAPARTTGFHSWTEAEISAFERAHPTGSRARLALALLLYTAQRRSDVVRMGRQHLRDGRLAIRQQKTGTAIEIPLHPKLQAILAGLPTDQLTFLVTGAGRPFSAAGFGNLFREWCNTAGLPSRCAAHGLRKAALTRLAEIGCSAHQIAAIGGLKSLSQVQLYTRGADQKRLADEAMGMLVAAPERDESGTKSTNLVRSRLQTDR